MNWIKTSERLPEIGEYVNVRFSDEYVHELCMTNDEDCIYWIDRDGDFAADVKNQSWQPIPPLPEEQ